MKSYHVKKKFFYFITNLFFCFLLGCVSEKKKIKYYKDIFILNKSSIESKEKRAIIFYNSDDHLLLPYFSYNFTSRINQENFFKVFPNTTLNKIWLTNNLNAKEIENVEEKIIHLTELLSNEVKNGNMTKAHNTAYLYQNDVKKFMLNNPIEVNRKVISEFNFWLSIASLNNKNIATNALIAYQKYSTLSERNYLEAQIDEQFLKQWEKLLQTVSKIKQKSIPIIQKNKCYVFINGQSIKTRKINLPLNMESVVSASCSNGTFSKIFTPHQIDKLIIEPLDTISVESMPALSALPKELLAHEKVHALIVIYWSHKNKYIESAVLETKNFSVINTIHLDLKTEKELEEAGNHLIDFLKIAYEKCNRLDELSPNDLGGLLKNK